MSRWVKRSRRWLNPIQYLDRHHSTGGSIAWVVNSNDFGSPSVSLLIKDCHRGVELEVECCTSEQRKKTLKKLNILIDSLTKLRGHIRELEYPND